MRQTGKLDYLELPATGGTLDSVKAFYSAAFGWSFTDYGPTYSAFEEGLDGGFQAEAAEAPAKPLPWRALECSRMICWYSWSRLMQCRPQA